ncbi:MAG: YkgJ family cysteine cluster protein [Pseudobdellovibrio sp.]
MQSEWIHPCQKCGACCASFRVSFYWREAEKTDTQHPVPSNYWIESTPEHRVMKGTENKHHPKCCALKGKVGQSVGCEIYTHRPTPCRSFQASYENGSYNSRCDEARAKHGLKPLQKSDWPLKKLPSPTL